jgi:5-methylcytosine-specific restriction endonuclease McrBC GTP-binding regulatory subunit McrB
MKTYKVTVSYVSYCHAEIEADSIDEAIELARNMDGGDFIPAQDNDDWSIEDVYEVTE